MNARISKILHNKLVEFVQHDMGKAKELFKGMIEIETNRLYCEMVRYGCAKSDTLELKNEYTN